MGLFNLILAAESAASGAPAGSDASLAWIITALALGLVLWAAGGSIIRPAVGALGLAGGAILGRLVWLETGVGPEWVLPLVGALTTACVALLAWHLASGLSLCLLLGLLTAVTTWALIALIAPDDQPLPQPPVAMLFGLDEAPLPDADAPVSAPSAPVLSADETIGNIAAELEARPELRPVRAAWALVPGADRFAILIAGGSAALLGLLLSALASRTSAVLLTAVGGALMIAGSVPRLFQALGGTSLGFSPQESALFAIGCWLGLSVLGLLIQFAMGTPPPQQVVVAD
ncbi:MAG: hypothetical protein MK101_09130 [Phycisphaerales bacterium]|nr:hypothetical protein [Phycisphaerales bacterium]